jgi:hypothetical protein
MIDDNFINNWIIEYKKAFREHAYDYMALCLGNCYIRLDDYEMSRGWFIESCKNMFREKSSWKISGSPNYLVDVWVMSNISGFETKIKEELDSFQKDRYGGNSPIANYAYCIWKLISSEDTLEEKDYSSLLKLGDRHKYGFYLGRSLKSISTQNNSLFLESLRDLLKAHERSAKHGKLRETPEGLICLSAMTLGLIASKRGMTINIECEYFSMGYLKFLLQQRKSYLHNKTEAS